MLHEPAGQDADRPGGAGRVQGPQQLDGVPVVIDADLAGQVAVQQVPDRDFGPGRE